MIFIHTKYLSGDNNHDHKINFILFDSVNHYYNYYVCCTWWHKPSMVKVFQLHTVVHFNHINIFIMHAFFMWICLEVSFYPVSFSSGYFWSSVGKTSKIHTTKNNEKTSICLHKIYSCAGLTFATFSLGLNPLVRSVTGYTKRDTH